MEKERLTYIDTSKFLLIIGILLYHSSVILYTGWPLPEYVSPSVAGDFDRMYGVCNIFHFGSVGSFFIFAGYLFFRGLDRFTFRIYGEKLRRRILTLLVPYILWNFIALAKLYFGGTFVYTGIPDLIEGFWRFYREDCLPYAFAFWFIRNLLVFCILSPLACAIASRWWIYAAMMAAGLVLETNFQWFIWFVTGAVFARRRISFGNVKGGMLAVAALSTLLFAVPGINKGFIGCLNALVATMGYYILLEGLGRRLNMHCGGKALTTLVSSTFFLYAFHQLICKNVMAMNVKCLGLNTSAEVWGVFMLSFLTTFIVSLAVWAVFRKFAPRLLGVLTGGRTGDDNAKKQGE